MHKKLCLKHVKIRCKLKLYDSFEYAKIFNVSIFNAQRALTISDKKIEKRLLGNQQILFNFYMYAHYTTLSQ
jgi:hypothetical protein